MARCKYCGAEGLLWKHFDADSLDWDLKEPDGEYHECKLEDRKKEYERCVAEKAQTDLATRKYKEANGYL